MSLQIAIDEGDYGGVLAAVREQPSWTEESLGEVHNALIAWVERALSNGAENMDGTAEALYDLIGRLRACHGDEAINALRKGTASEWRGLEQVLDERVAKMQSGEVKRGLVARRRHVAEILSALDGGKTLPFEALRSQLGVSQSLLSQVLSTMESAQMVVRERAAEDSRVKQVRLSDKEARLRRNVVKPIVRTAASNSEHGAFELCGFPTGRAA